MSNRQGLASVALFVGLSAPAAQATIPGGGASMNANFQEGILHVCKDVEPGDSSYVVCQEPVNADPTEVYTATECIPAGLPQVCVADFVPKTKVKLTMTLVVDDNAKAFDDSDDGRHAAIVLEGKIKGTKVLLTDLFFDSKLGNWNSFSEAELEALPNVVFSAASVTPAATWDVVYQFSRENLADLGDRLLEILDAHLTKIDLAGEGVVAVVTNVKPVPKKGEASESATLVGSAKRYKVTIEFARVRN